MTNEPLQDAVARAIEEHDPYKVVFGFGHPERGTATVGELKDRQTAAVIAAATPVIIAEERERLMEVARRNRDDPADDYEIYDIILQFLEVETALAKRERNTP